MADSVYLAIDLKSFYASVECAERGLDPLNANLVVADESRTDKTICLAVSPALKAVGVPSRPRLFEAKARISEINAERRSRTPKGRFGRRSVMASELAADPTLELDMIIAAPRMSLYMDYSRRIYGIYLRHVAPEDIFAYSVDEVFLDAGRYLAWEGLSAHEFAMRMIREVLQETGITATAGIGSNMYLAKVAMDIVAKRLPPDPDGVRIAELDEQSYREKLWDHRPLTDFWRIGRGIARKLESRGLYTMGDIALCSVGKDSDYYNEELLYRLFGINAELLIDHAWGWEPTRICDVKNYRPSSRSLSSGQVLPEPYTAEKGCLVLREMADRLGLDLMKKGCRTDQLVVDVAYDIQNLSDPQRAGRYRGPVIRDFYGRAVPQPVHGSCRLKKPTASSEQLIRAAEQIYRRIVDPSLLVRRLNVCAVNLAESESPEGRQLSLFDRPEDPAEQARNEKEGRMQQTLLALQSRYGKNAVLRGMNLEKGATARARNEQIGGHRA